MVLSKNGVSADETKTQDIKKLKKLEKKQNWEVF